MKRRPDPPRPHASEPEPRTPVAWAALGATGIAAAAYLPTMARHVGFVDRGELAAVATTLGIAHPTGYPLLTLLGHLASRLAPGHPLLALNALAAVWTALGVGVMTWLYHEVLDLLPPPPGGVSRWEQPGIAALAALGTGFAGIWWEQANGFEVYALESLLLPLVCVLFLRFVSAAERDRDGAGAAGIAIYSAAGRSGIVFAFVLGLAFANHLTTGLLAPGFLTYYFMRLGARGLRRWPALVPPFVLGLTSYLYLPLRSGAGPRFDWGGPHTLTAFLDHVTGHQYQGWMFSGANVAGQQLGYLGARLPGEFAFAGILVAVVGIASMLRRDGALAAWALLIAAASLAFFAGYAIREVDPYVVPLLMMVGAMIAAGWWALRRVAPAPVVVTLAAALCVATCALHARASDESGNVLAENLSRDVLESLPPNAVLFSDLWEYVVGPSYYLQAVAAIRPDVTVITPELMRHPWYLDELRRRDPGLCAAAGATFDSCRAELIGHPARDREGAIRAGGTRDELLSRMIASGRAGRRAFVTLDLSGSTWAAGERTPLGLVSELRADTGYVAVPVTRTRYVPWVGHPDFYPVLVSRFYAESLLLRAQYEAAHGRHELALQWLAAGERYRPPFEPADLPPLPFGGNALAIETFGFFDRLKQGAEGR